MAFSDRFHDGSDTIIVQPEGEQKEKELPVPVYVPEGSHNFGNALSDRASCLVGGRPSTGGSETCRFQCPSIQPPSPGCGCRAQNADIWFSFPAPSIFEIIGFITSVVRGFIP
jgi:hypothetical protein